jgi:adenosine deaminase
VTPTSEQIKNAPKVALHEHLDGGVRPATIVEIAAEIGHDLPAEGAEALGAWFEEASSSGSLVRYLETFVHTVAVMQRPEDLARVVDFLVAPELTHVTGQVLFVDGGAEATLRSASHF